MWSRIDFLDEQDSNDDVSEGKIRTFRGLARRYLLRISMLICIVAIFPNIALAQRIWIQSEASPYVVYIGTSERLYRFCRDSEGDRLYIKVNSQMDIPFPPKHLSCIDVSGRRLEVFNTTGPTVNFYYELIQ